MRRKTFQGWHRAVAALAAAAFIAVPGLAQAAPPANPPADFGPKVDMPLALVAKEAQAHDGPQALVHVIAYGDAGSALGRFGATDVEYLSLINAYSATMRVANLNALANSPGISHVTVDSPVKGNGTVVSGASL